MQNPRLRTVIEFVKKNMVRYMRPHGRFAHCSCKNAALTRGRGRQAEVAGSSCIFTLAVHHPPVLASCIEIYYFFIHAYKTLVCESPHGRFAHCSCKNAALTLGFMPHFYTCSAPTACFSLLYRNIQFRRRPPQIRLVKWRLDWPHHI